MLGFASPGVLVAHFIFLSVGHDAVLRQSDVCVVWGCWELSCLRFFHDF